MKSEGVRNDLCLTGQNKKVRGAGVASDKEYLSDTSGVDPDFSALSETSGVQSDKKGPPCFQQKAPISKQSKKTRVTSKQQSKITSGSAMMSGSRQCVLFGMVD